MCLTTWYLLLATVLEMHSEQEYSQLQAISQSVWRVQEAVLGGSELGIVKVFLHGCCFWARNMGES